MLLSKRLTNEDIIEAIKTNKRATTCKCYYKSWLAERSTRRKVFFLIFLRKRIYMNIEKKIPSVSFTRQASSYRINMQLIEGQMFFYIYKKTDQIKYI